MWMRPRTLSFARPAATVAASAVATVFLHTALFPSAPASCESKDSASKSNGKALSFWSFQSLPVRQIETLTHNTRRITLALPNANDETGLTPVSLILVRAVVDGKSVIRPYTPTSLNDDLGRVELTIKSYPEGKMSKHLGNLQVGDHLDVRGPIVNLKYVPNQYEHIGMISGGVGITPMLQLARTICRNPEDKTRITLICANTTENDMLLREELEEMQKKYPQLTVHHVLSAPSESWKGRRGHVSSEMVQELMPKPDDSKFFICVCGPPGMMEHVCGDKWFFIRQGKLQGLLKQLGYKSDQVFKF